MATELRPCPFCGGKAEYDEWAYDTLPGVICTNGECECRLLGGPEEWNRRIDDFEPDWDAAPEWAEWHTVDESGQGMWHRRTPDIVEPNSDPGVWYSDMDAEECGAFDCVGDWRNSLRHRPYAEAEDGD